MPIQPLSQFDFHQVLTATPGVSLVMFGAPGCGACRHLKRVFARLAEQAPTLNLFEVDAQQDMALVREFEVFHLPSLFLFRDGRFHCPLHSTPEPAEILRRIDQALAEPAREAP